MAYVKDHTLYVSSHAQYHASVEPGCEAVSTIISYDFPFRASNCGHVAEFPASFSRSFTAHAQKRLFVSF